MNNKKSKMLMNGILLAAITTIGIGSYQLMISPDYEDIVSSKEKVMEEKKESLDENSAMLDADTKNVIASLDGKDSSTQKDGTEGIMKEVDSEAGELQGETAEALSEGMTSDGSILEEMTSDRITLEGMTSNGTNLEEMTSNGTNLEGMTSNGTSLEGMTSDETSLEGMTSDETSLEKMTPYETTSGETISAETSSTAVGVPVPAAAYLDFSEDTMMEWPVHGNIILDYDMEQTTYFPTLDQYRLNPAIAVQAVEGAPVNASVDGVVYRIENDPRTGTTVTMELGNGYQAIYGQLKDLTVYEGETIERGSTIGYIAAPTKYYSEEGSNLYYAMKKNGEPIDPVLYLP